MPLIKMTAVSSRDLTKEAENIVKQVRADAKKHLKIWARIFKVEYIKTHANWPRQPIWNIKFESTPEGESAIISTNNNIYRFLHDGTKIRWAVMSNPFEPKTRPRVLGSGPGVGKAVLKGRTAMAAHGIQTAMPGIEAREWTQEILRLYETKFQDDMDKAVFGHFPTN